MSSYKLIQFFLFLLIAYTPLYSAIEPNEKIVLIHGFLGASWNLQYHEHMLKKAHLNAIGWDYSSREKTIQMHAEDLVAYLKNEVNQNPHRPIHFLTHSEAVKKLEWLRFCEDFLADFKNHPHLQRPMCRCRWG